MFQGEFDPVSPSQLKNIYLIYDKESGTAEALDRFIHTYIVTSEALGFKRAATEAALKKFGLGKVNLEQHTDQVDVTIRVDDHSINTHFSPAGS
ncbi:hypothetical protein [Sporolactobacillus vineae]|uniref:hypothetical protein n=1 Tax=Sporolactobacillus vineae TaxID=444463 RepID=UPI000289C351|nr:hypothetical protein [Sporolactobacillus vineae]